MKRLTRCGFWLATLALGLCPTLVFAAEPEKLAKPGNEGWISVTVAMVLAVGVAVGSFINPKRSHRD